MPNQPGLVTRWFQRRRPVTQRGELRLSSRRWQGALEQAAAHRRAMSLAPNIAPWRPAQPRARKQLGDFGRARHGQGRGRREQAPGARRAARACARRRAPTAASRPSARPRARPADRRFPPPSAPSTARAGLAFVRERAQHVEAHHVAGAFPDRVDRRLAIEPRQHALLDIAVAAEALHRLVDEGRARSCRPRYFTAGGEQPRPRRFARIVPRRDRTNGRAA